MSIKALLSITPTLQAASLAAGTARKATKKDKSVGDITKSATEILVGVPLIKTQFNLIQGL